MCTILLPPGDNPIAVDKYIISYYLFKNICVKEPINANVIIINAMTLL